MKKIKVQVSGTAPLLINKFIYNPEGNTRKKTVYIPEEEAEKKVYRNKEGKCYIPTKNFKAAMIKAGTDFKMSGRKTYKEYIKSGIFFEKEEAILNPEEYVIHAEQVCIQRAMVMSWRPKFENWKTEFTMMVADDMLDKNMLKQILEAAGQYKGVGSYRPEYGRFKIDSFETISEE